MRPSELVGKVLVGPNPYFGAPDAPNEGAVADYFRDATWTVADLDEVMQRKPEPGLVMSTVYHLLGYSDAPVAHNLRFLLWQAGVATTATLWRPVISGPFSGCWLFNIRDRQVVHVGTGSGAWAAGMNVAVKTAFRNHVRGLRPGTVMGFSPSEYVNVGTLPGSTPAGDDFTSKEAWGMYTTDGTPWALGIGKITGGDGQPIGYYVLEARRAIARTWENIDGQHEDWL